MNSEKKYKLTLMHRIAKRIFNEKLLREIWESRKLQYQDVFKINYWETFPDHEDYSPILVPEPGFLVKEISTRIYGNKIILESEMLPEISKIISGKEKYITAAGLLIVHDPIKQQKYGGLLVIPVDFEKQLMDKSGSLRLTQSFGQNTMTLIHGYRRKQLFLVLVTLDKDDKPVNYSRQIKNEYLERVL